VLVREKSRVGNAAGERRPLARAARTPKVSGDLLG